jgi:hypothetical protein
MSKMDVDGSRTVGHHANPRACHCIPLSQIDNAILLEGFELWRSLCGEHKYPPRSAVTPRLLKPMLRNTTLLRVINGGEDYEYRIVGDAYVMAHGRSYQGKLWSETGEMSAGVQKFIKPVYDRVVQDGEPVATLGWIERGGSSTGLVYCEYIYLPLGDEAAGVDHILAFAVYVRRDGLEHVGAAPSVFTT